MAFWLYAALGALGVQVAAAAASRLSVGHLAPDVPCLLVAFLAMRPPMLRAIAVATTLGFVVDHAACAPAGLHATALAATAVATASVAGHVGGTGASHFAGVAASAQVAYQLALVALLAWQGHHVGFVSFGAALLVPQAALSWRPLLHLSHRLGPHRRKRTWH